MSAKGWSKPKAGWPGLFAGLGDRATSAGLLVLMVATASAKAVWTVAAKSLKSSCSARSWSLSLGEEAVLAEAGLAEAGQTEGAGGLQVWGELGGQQFWVRWWLPEGAAGAARRGAGWSQSRPAMGGPEWPGGAGSDRDWKA
jgi:hypothetical protein